MKGIAKMSSSHPLQSKEWGKFREAWGNEVIWTDYGLLTLHRIPYTKYKVGMFIKGPEPSQKMLNDLIVLGKKHNLIFIKLEPNIGWGFPIFNLQFPIKSKFIKILKKNGCVRGKTLFTPTTFWIDLTKTEEELMNSFSAKTRYNIRLAERKGVRVKEDNSDGAFEKYLELTFETTKRQGFYAHTPEYHKLMWKYLHTLPTSKNQLPIAHLITATFQKEIITTWILFGYRNFLYYPYGASTDKYKNVMANNLVMWEAIKLGKKLGAKKFDLWGREPGKGFTKFKEGYNPQVIEFLGTWDLVINNPLYSIYQFAEKARWSILRLKSRFTSSS